MLPANNIQSIVGATLYGRDKAKIGRVDQVLVDAADGHPTWAVLHGGIFGRKNLFVPLDDATWEHDDVFVDLDKDDVKNSPHPDAAGGLSPAEEQELRAYYAGLRGGEGPVAAAPVPAPTPAAADVTQDVAERDAPASVDRDRIDETDDGPRHAADADAPAPSTAPAAMPETPSAPTATAPAPARDTDDTDPDDTRPGPGCIVI
ncbi:PRC-barrel domain-containing protein [Herbiconiux ginsengi]|uniref:PRC-barrel domain-containing protein n=1 Tax=Herbiconiux ginsengi TaxID=381665 RepID=A0A1H3KLJ2_9MICO|nr:PRC-barrel domain-containing protein [Herbiconiux ginsengi]SDY52910.1 PRC-barrel domain-containing protein [Herbiconiux ginsengi]